MKSKLIKMMTIVIGLFATTSAFAAIEQKGPPPSPVKVEQVQQTSIVPTATIMGTVFSRNQTQVTAGVNGKLEWVAEPGTYLKRGDLVAQIELLPLQLLQAEKKAQFKRSEINLRYLKKELKRQKQLRRAKNTSQLLLDQTQSQVEIAESDKEIADLQLKQINDQLSKATVIAPFEGVVTSRVRRAGFDVSRSDILVTLLDTQNLEVRVFVPVKYLAFTKPGSSVVLSSRDDNNQLLQLAATASSIIPSADALSQTFEMRINVPMQGREYWAAGQLISVKIPVEDERQALTVHRDALILRSDGTYVVKIDQENKAKRIKVVVGKGQDNWVSIIGEIKNGDKVAVRGAERLVDGQSVIINQDDV